MMMFRCTKCGSGIVQWSHADRMVMECKVCSVQWVIKSEELVEWSQQLDGSFTNREEF